MPHVRRDPEGRAGHLAHPGERRAHRRAALDHLRCPRCREEVLTFTQARRFEEDAIAIYRKRYGLLSGDEIRGIRSHLGLTQAELARLLRLGPNTISRWEAGRNVQTGSLDVLLRLIRDLPGSLAYLREHAA